ncbi:class I SAM-dependent methyltransferase [Clostridium sp. Mt-5]|uniref:Class I SAM-dependent methyltransferase n=1 Tax=Clostridium moutaii TaxID=3240932 RepID=A0ABV4BJ27_9CLOT
MEEYKVIYNKKFGYRKLNPIPSRDELNNFYVKDYYKATQNINNKVDDEDTIWLQKTEYKDAYDIFNEYLLEGKLLDIGCGMGKFLSYMKEKGYDTFGIEPSLIACKKSKNIGLKIENCSIYDFESNDRKFDIINLTNVLEHLIDPLKAIEICKKMLNKKGIIRIKVPNDFNKLQLELCKNFNKGKYWVAIPDHINYFNLESLTNILEFYGFRIINKTVDFPMELFIFMGKDYIKNRNIGKICHEERKKLELSITNNLRRKLYNSFCNIGIGRNIIIYGILN